MLRRKNLFSYLILAICLSFLTFIPTHLANTSPSSADTYEADAWCYAINYGPFTDCGAQAHAWSIPYSSVSNEYTYGDYNTRYGNIRVKWYSDPSDYRNEGVFNYGCSEWASFTETYWFIGSGDFSARSKAFVRNQDGNESDSGSVN